MMDKPRGLAAEKQAANQATDNQGMVARGTPPPSDCAIHDKELVAKILEMIAKGHFLNMAAAYAGISARQVKTWLSRGRRQVSPEYVAFRQAFDRAYAEAEEKHLSKIMRDPSWQASAWWLERRDYKRWGKKEQPLKLEVSEPPKRIKSVVAEIKDVLRNQALAQQAQQSNSAQSSNGHAGGKHAE